MVHNAYYMNLLHGTPLVNRLPCALTTRQSVRNFWNLAGCWTRGGLNLSPRPHFIPLAGHWINRGYKFEPQTPFFEGLLETTEEPMLMNLPRAFIKLLNELY